MKMKSLFMFLAAWALAMTTNWGCVEVPSSGFQPPNLRSSIRYIHAGRGTDTIAVFVSDTTRTDTTVTTSQVVVGTDTVVIRDSLFVERLTKIYRRVKVDFGASFELRVDGGTKGTLSLGQGTQYFDTPSGSRKIGLRATVPLVDSTVIMKLDSTRVVLYDTVGKGTNRVETTGSGTQDTSFALSGNLTAIVDSEQVSIATETKSTMFLVGDTLASTSLEGGLIRFGRIRYTVATERQTFENAGIPDTAVVRFANASVALGVVDTISAGANTILGLAYSRITTYRKLPARIDTSYTVVLTKTGLPPVSYSLPVSKTHRYTVAVIDSALTDSTSTFVLRKYNDD